MLGPFFVGRPAGRPSPAPLPAVALPYANENRRNMPDGNPPRNLSPPQHVRKQAAFLRSSEVMPAATPALQRLSASPDNGNRRWLRAVALDDVPDRVHRHAGRRRRAENRVGMLPGRGEDQFVIVAAREQSRQEPWIVGEEGAARIGQ